LSAQRDFEIYVLMTMKLRLSMSQKSDRLDLKLAEFGLSVDDGERIRARIAQELGDESTFAGSLQRALNPSAMHEDSVRFDSTVWPGFEFRIGSGEDGKPLPAGYRKIVRHALEANSPKSVGLWATDVEEFDALFGPLAPGTARSLFDEYLPAYQEYEFEWNDWSWGAGFSWGLFMFAAESWE
jgi:hypothetical protein